MECTWRRLGSFKGNSYYIRTISPYPYDIRTISEAYIRRTSVRRLYGIRTVFVRRLYEIFRTSGLWDVRIPSLYIPFATNLYVRAVKAFTFCVGLALLAR